jgi:tryptophanyl-tRNA synthetase
MALAKNLLVESTQRMTTILTGIRANGELTLGNYLGGILPMIQLQRTLKPEDKLHLFIPDLHSFVTDIDHGTLYANVLQNTRIFLGAGIDTALPQLSLYRQSRISAHSEVAWILSCFTHYGEMRRMTQFKDKSAQPGATPTVGLFTYPILQAADILLYDAEYIPVGDDQKQHIEITRDIGLRLNAKFGQDLFVVPKPWKDQLIFSKRHEGVRIRSLQNPDAKMSKSISDPKGTILLSDIPSDAAKKIMSAATDSLSSIDWNWQQRPGITNLLSIASLLAGQPQEQITARWKGSSQYGEFKKHVAYLVADFLSTFQTRCAQYSDERLEQLLTASEKDIEIVANKKLEKLQKAIGLKK